MDEMIKQPFVVRGYTLLNRLVLPPMASWSVDGRDHATEKTVQYYREKCEGGAIGLAIAEHCYISKNGKAHSGQLSVSEDAAIKGLSEIALAMKSGGAKTILQLSHAGGATDKSITGEDNMAPSLCGCDLLKRVDREMTREDIDDVIEEFVKAAKRAMEAGFDGVEVHSAHGYLLNQFYSPLCNFRNDEYGGTMQNRLRLHKEVIAAVRKAVGDNKLVLLRLGAVDYIEGGNTIKDAAEAGRILSDCDLDFIDISGGMCGTTRKGFEKVQGYFADGSEEVKKNCKLPVILTGGFTDISMAEQCLRDGKADFIGVGRAIHRDSKWAVKAMASLGAAYEVQGID